jgi:hypothetical protein
MDLHLSYICPTFASLVLGRWGIWWIFVAYVSWVLLFLGVHIWPLLPPRWWWPRGWLPTIWSKFASWLAISLLVILVCDFIFYIVILCVQHCIWLTMAKMSNLSRLWCCDKGCLMYLFIRLMMLRFFVSMHVSWVVIVWHWEQVVKCRPMLRVCIVGLGVFRLCEGC